jgi:hypothetical protein
LPLAALALLTPIMAVMAVILHLHWQRLLMAGLLLKLMAGTILALGEDNFLLRLPEFQAPL